MFTSSFGLTKMFVNKLYLLYISEVDEKIGFRQRSEQASHCVA